MIWGVAAEKGPQAAVATPLADFPGLNCQPGYGRQFIDIAHTPGHVETFAFRAYPINGAAGLQLDVRVPDDTAGEVTARVEIRLARY